MENKILANVGGIAITNKDIDEFLTGLGQRGAGYNTPDGRRAVLNQLVANKLLLLEARKNLYETEADFKAQLAKFKENLLTSYAMEKALSAVTVSDKDVEDFYNNNTERFMGEETVSASHILVATEEEAREIYARIEKGESSFEEEALAHSTCPSKANGGNLGEFGKGQMVPEFDVAVFSMQVGEITSEPVKTQFGYHLIKLNEKNEAKVTPLDEIREELKGVLLDEKKQKAYESKINQLQILFPVDYVD
jgi:peptidyl-prolyl cis-trans isomerase C